MFNKSLMLTTIFTVILLSFGGCSSGGSSDSTTSSSLDGVAQKGPFLNGSVVSLCKLDESMACTGDALEVKVTDDKGSYQFKTLSWSGLSRLTISGYYLDELTGTTSLSPATITAIVNIKSKIKNQTNVNILTDMRAKRMKELVGKGRSIDEAADESKDDVKKLFNITSDDFTVLDLVDFSQGSASLNVELLRISAAVANAEDPIATLEELMKIYNEYGIEAVLNSTLYRTLMGLIEDVDVKEVLTQMVGVDEANTATIGDLAPFAIANVVTYGVVNSDAKVRITLIGTEFTGEPIISLSSSDSSLGIDAISLSDDNRSAILDMNKSTSCQEINATFTIDYMTLKEIDSPIRTANLKYMNDSSFCSSSIADDDVNSVPVVIAPTAIISLVALEHNQIKLSLLGTEFENYTGSINAELITSSTTLAIDNTVVADNNKSVVFTLNEATNYCAENNVTIRLSADSLKDVSSVLESNKIRYVSPNTLADCGANSNPVPIPFNRAPTVSITPSSVTQIPVGTVLELDAAAFDANSEDIVTLQWLYKREGGMFKNDGITSSKFIRQYDTLGSHVVNVTATDNHGAETTASVEFEVVAVNHAPTVSISPSEDKNIYVGGSVLLKSSASDEDGDALTISWKLKESGDADFTTVANFGETGFNYTFNELGTYLVVVEAQDGNGSKADANITVNVTEVPPIAITLDDINIEVDVKGTYSFDTGIADSVDMSIDIAPEHGTVEAYVVGEEFWNLRFTGTDCFVGSDSFIYKSGDDYGRVNVTITSPSNLNANNATASIFNTETISGEYLRANSVSIGIEITKATTGGSSSLVVVGNEVVNYDYDPDDSFVGNDYFEYTLSETIDECSYTDIGRVDIEVKEYVQELKLLGICQDPYNIGNELYKTDGTLGGTTLVKNINYQERSGVGFMLSDEYKIGDLLFFGAYDGDRELWQSDGVNTYENNINSSYESTLRGSSYPHCFKMANEKLYFIAADKNSSNYGMYRADGETITRLSDINSLNNPNDDCGRMNFNEDTDSMYFFVRDNNYSTLNKANMDFSTVEEIVAHEGYEHKNLEVIDSDIFYQIGINDGWSSSLELWRKKSAEPAVELFSGQYEFQDTLIEAENKVFASGRNKAFQDDSFDAENRKMRLFEVTKTSQSELFNMENGTIRYLTYLNGEVFFIWWHFDESTYDEFHELYKYNISSQELTQLKVITRMIEGNPNHTGPMMQDMYKFEDKIFVRSIYVDEGDDPIYRDQLWVSDGTVDGTKVINEIEMGEYSSSTEFGHFTINNEHFMQDEHGFVYKTDYTKDGTNLVIPNSCDISPDWFSAPSVIDVEVSSYYELNATVTGISYDETKVSIVDGEYSIGDTNSWTSEEGTISNSQIIYFRHQSSASFETMVSTTINIGSISATFSSTTKAE